MGVVKGAVACAVVALLAAHELSGLDGARRAALWAAVRAAAGGAGPAAVAPPLAMPRFAAPSLPAAPPTMARPSSSASVPTFGEEWIPADRMGQFQTTVEIDGRRVPVLVDTGATFVALSAEDADRIGLRPAPSDFRYAVSTANGQARVAKVRLGSVRLGDIALRDVDALVSGPGQLGQTLLGMSFLSRLSSVRIDRGRLILSR